MSYIVRLLSIFSNLIPYAISQITARKRGPNPFDIRAGVKPREELDLSSFLNEAPPEVPKRFSEMGTQGDELTGGVAAPGALDGPTHIHKKVGVDASSQVDHGSTEFIYTPGAHDAPLFNFDTAASAITDTLTEIVLEQGLLEVEHETELLELAKRREVVEAALGADADLEKKLAEEARSRVKKRNALITGAQQDYKRAIEAMEKISAQMLAKKMIEGGGSSSASAVAVGVLRESGHFVDPTEEMVRSELLPDLYAAVSNSVNARNEAATLIVDGLIDDSFAASLNVFNLAASEEAARKAEMEKNYFIRVFVRLPRRAEDVAKFGMLPEGAIAVVDGRTDLQPVQVIDTTEGSTSDAVNFRTVVVGPCRVRRIDSVRDVEVRISEWLKEYNNQHTRRVLSMAGGPNSLLALWANGHRLDPNGPLLRPTGHPLDGLGGLELKPRTDWDLSIAEEEI